MHRPRPFAALAALLGCVCLLLAASGCGAVVTAGGAPDAARTTSRPASAAPLLSLHAVRTSAFAENKVAAFDETSADAAGIAQLYAAIVALKPWPPGAYACPADFGVEYHLTFTRADGATDAALVYPDGCAWAGITDSATGSTPHGQIADWNGFWSLFAGVFAVPMSALDYVTQSPYGPYAPAHTP